MQTIILQLDWKLNAQFAGILYAHHFGLYKQAGIDLEIRPWQACTNQVEILQNHPNMVVSTDDNLLIEAVGNGAKLKGIAAMMQFSGLGWMTLKDNNIRTITDLKGKKVGIHNDGVVGIHAALHNAGVPVDEVTIDIVGYDYQELLASAEYDAMQCLIMVEPLEVEEEGYDLHVLKASDYGYKTYCQVFTVNDLFLESNRELMKSFLKVSFDGWRFAYENPRLISEIIVNEYLEESTPGLQERMLEAMKPIIIGEVGMSRLGWMTESRWKQSISYLETTNRINTNVPVESVMTNDLMEEVYS